MHTLDIIVAVAWVAMLIYLIVEGRKIHKLIKAEDIEVAKKNKKRNDRVLFVGLILLYTFGIIRYVT